MLGKLITLDGIDGAGKSTQLAYIKDWLQSKDISAIFTREPGGTVLGEKIRNILLDTDTDISIETETLLLFAARQQHIQEIIVPALRKGLTVVSDRFTDATYAYQCGGRGIAENKVVILEEWVQEMLKPDLTIILDIPVSVSLSRLEKGRVKDRFEMENIAFFERVRKTYLNKVKSDQKRYKLLSTHREKIEVMNELDQILSSFYEQE